MIGGVHHVAISVPDMDRALAFYRDLLGGTVVIDAQWEQGEMEIDQIVRLKGTSGHLVMLRLGNAHIELFKWFTPPAASGDAARPVNDEGYTHFCLDVDSCDVEYERLRDAGMEFHSPPHDLPGFGVRVTYGRDPFGNVIELQQIVTNDAIRL